MNAPSPIAPSTPPDPGKVAGAKGIAGIYDVRAFGAAGDAMTPSRISRHVAHYLNFRHSHGHHSLIWGENFNDFAITGLGMIDGGLYDFGGNNNPATSFAPLPSI